MAVDHLYYLFLDEIYNPNLRYVSRKTRKEIVDSENHHHFGIGGPIVPANELPVLNFKFRKIQNKFYPHKDFPIIHYVDVLNKRGMFTDLNLNKPKEQSLHDVVSNTISDLDFHAIFTFIDQEKLILKYGKFDKFNKPKLIGKIRGNIFKKALIKDYDLYYLSLRFLLINFYEYLSRRNSRGIIVAEARGDKEDISLRNAFTEIQIHGIGSIGVRDLRGTINEIFIVHKKQNHAGLQLADSLLYPVYDSMVDCHNTRKDHWIDFKKTIEPKVYQKQIKVFPS